MKHKLLLAFLTLLLAIPTFAQTFTHTYEGQTLRYTVSDETAKTCYVDCNYNISGDVIIPKSVTCRDDTFSVTAINNNSFSQNKALTSVTIPNSVTSIGEYAFFKCSSLAKILVDLENQRYTSFEGVLFNKDMTEIIACPEGLPTAVYHVPSSVTSIGTKAFYNCSQLTSVNIPNSVTSIGDHAFSYCNSLTSMTIPNSVTSICDFAFSDCCGLTSVTIPNSVTEIGKAAFYWCNGLTSVIIPNSVTEISSSLFECCDGLTSVTIPNSVTSIGDHAFSDCRRLTSVTIPNSVTSIGDLAFYYCEELTSVTIPNSVTLIGRQAFHYCSSLTSVTIPNSVNKIESYAFYGCNSLTEVNYNTTELITADSSAFTSYDSATLYVAVGGLEAARQTTPWSLFKDIREKEFEGPGEEEPVARTVIVKLPGGTLHFPEEEAGMTIRLVADDDCEFHSATLDGEDVSDSVGEKGHFTVPEVEKPTVLNVVFKQKNDTETGINAVSVGEDEVRVTVHGKRVSISGKDADTAVRAYDLRGVLLEDTTDSEFTLEHSGVVILRIGSATYKFAI